MNNNRFKDWANDYQIFEDLIDKNDKEIQEDVAKLVKNYLPNNESIIFDAGCGTGNTAISLMKFVPNLAIILNDLDPEMIKQSKENLKPICNTCIFKEGDAISVLQDENPFDVFVSVLIIHNIAKERRRELLELAFKKLKNGGLYINGDKMIDDKSPDKFTEKYNKRIEKLSVLKEIGRDDLFEKWTQHEKEDFENLQTIEEHIKVLKEVGFVDIKFEKQLGLYSIVTAKKPWY